MHGSFIACAQLERRLAQFKKVKGLVQSVRELRNRLAELEAFKGSNSAEQAAFLTGKSSKYGAKALLRANAVSFSDLVEDVEKTGAKVRLALREDCRYDT